ncbi:MAG: hypothetical protein ACUVRD_01235 [Bacteroidia bacterium]
MRTYNLIKILCAFGISVGQGVQSVLQLRPLTEEQIRNLPAEDGTVVFNAAGYLQYYFQGRWYSVRGECMPMPKEPQVDTVWAAEGEIGILFPQGVLNWEGRVEVRLSPLGRQAEVQSREIVFDSIPMGVYMVEAQHFTPCGASPTWRREVVMRPSPCGEDYFLGGLCWQKRDYRVPVESLPRGTYIKTPRGEVLYRMDYIPKLPLPSGWRLPTPQEAERLESLLNPKRLQRFKPEFVGAYASEEGFIGIGEAVLYATNTPPKVIVMKEQGASTAHLPSSKVYLRIRLVRTP